VFFCLLDLSRRRHFVVCTASSKRVAVLVTRGVTQILLHVLVCESKDDECLSELLVAVHQLLAKLGPRGRILVSLECPRSFQYGYL